MCPLSALLQYVHWNEFDQQFVAVAKNDKIVQLPQHGDRIHNDIYGANQVGNRYQGDELEAEGNTRFSQDDEKSIKFNGQLIKKTLAVSFPLSSLEGKSMRMFVSDSPSR